MTEDEASSNFTEHSLERGGLPVDLDAATDEERQAAAREALLRLMTVNPTGLEYGPDGQRISVMETMSWYEVERHVAKTFLGPYEISTVFIPRDLSLGMSPVPLLWETMLWGLDDQDVMGRYPTRDAAGAGHLRLLESLARRFYYAAPPDRRHGIMRHLRSVRRSVRHLGDMELPRPPRSYRVYFEAGAEGGRLVWPEGRPTPGPPYEMV